MTVSDATITAAILQISADARESSMTDAEWAQRMGAVIGNAIRSATATQTSLDALDSLGNPIALIQGESSVA